MGAVFAIFGGLYYWMGKITGFRYPEAWGKLHFWLMFLGVNITFFVQHFLGLAGMPRRIPDYPDAFTEWNAISSYGSIVSLIASLIFFYTIYRTFSDLNDVDVINDQIECTRQFFDDSIESQINGGVTSLEWTLDNPPVLHTFEQQPYIA